MTMLNDYHQFTGLHWATGYLCNMLAYQGATTPHTGQPFTEAMLMGINGGLCAGYFAFDYQGWDPHLHFLTRYLFDETPGAVFERLGIPMHKQQTTNPEKATANLIGALAKGNPVAVWLDVLSAYNESDVPFPGMWMVTPVVVYGCDLKANCVHIADRARVPLTTSVDTFTAARGRIKKHRYQMMTIGAPNADKLPDAIRAGIQSCIDIFIHEPPVGAKSSFGLDAYQKWAKLLTDKKGKQSWAVMFAPGRRMYAGLTSSYRYLEIFFTGGHGSRGVYADFLDEAAIVLDKPILKDAAVQFRQAAARWDDLTMALLPNHIEPFRESRELMRRSYEAFLAQGNAALVERKQIYSRLEAIKADMEQNFPLSEAEAATMRLTLRDHVMQIHDAEKIAIDLLCQASV
jgi:hypothetical protein